MDSFDFKTVEPVGEYCQYPFVLLTYVDVVTHDCCKLGAINIPNESCEISFVFDKINVLVSPLTASAITYPADKKMVLVFTSIESTLALIEFPAGPVNASSKFSSTTQRTLDVMSNTLNVLVTKLEYISSISPDCKGVLTTLALTVVKGKLIEQEILDDNAAI